jgi:hypothetical protein
MEQNEEWEALSDELTKQYALHLGKTANLAQCHQVLAEEINNLVRSDFNKLIQILYRVDVDEAKLRRLLIEETGGNAGSIIASLIIDRQLQKIKQRKQGPSGNAQSDEEKW